MNSPQELTDYIFKVAKEKDVDPILLLFWLFKELGINPFTE